MYLHIGQNVMLAKRSVIGVFDLDNCTSSRAMKNFFAAAERGGEVYDNSGELPKSFVLWESLGDKRIYLSPLSSQTLAKRWDSRDFENS